MLLSNSNVYTTVLYYANTFYYMVVKLEICSIISNGLVVLVIWGMDHGSRQQPRLGDLPPTVTQP